MPDLLNSHLPPPAYSTLPHSGGGSRSSRSGGQPTPAGQPGQPPVGAAGPPPPTSMAVRSASSRLRFGRHQRLTNGTTDLQRYVLENFWMMKDIFFQKKSLTTYLQEKIVTFLVIEK